jgi:hypothetical protein
LLISILAEDPVFGQDTCMAMIIRIVSVAALLFVAGCATMPPAPVPAVSIVAARDLGPEVEVKVHYSGVTSGKFELNFGLGTSSAA